MTLTEITTNLTKDLAVTTAKIAALAVTTAKIAANAVTEAKLDSDAVVQTSIIGGLICSRESATMVNVAVGGARDSADSENMILPATITKKLQASGSWTAGDDQNGLDAGAVANSTLYAVWLIKVPSGAVDVLMSTSFTSPTMPSTYTLKRLIGAIRTDGSAQIISFTQVGDYFRYDGDVILDVNDASITTAFETGTLSAPPNSLAHIYLHVTAVDLGNTLAAHGFVRSVGSADVAAEPEAAAWVYLGADGGTDLTGGNAAANMSVLLDSSRQMQYAGRASNTIKISTFAFTMLTRRDP